MVALETMYGGKRPPFGHTMLKYFAFDPGYTNLNHGSYGSVPLPVISATEKLTLKIEASPDKFIHFEYDPALLVARARVAEFINADIDECVLVTNATMAINETLRNIEWNEGDVLVGATTTYDAVESTLLYIADTRPHPEIKTFQLNFPTTPAKMVAAFRSYIASIRKENPNAKIVAVIDGIISKPGALLPWEEMVQACTEEDVLSVIDAAHMIGQVKIDIKALAAKGVYPDFWFSNCHKWMFTRRGCAVFYVPRRNQHLIRSALPTNAQYVSPSDPRAPAFVAQHAWTGTNDLTAYLSVSAALEFREWLGGEDAINDYCHDLAIRGGKHLAERWGTIVMDENCDFAFTANIVNVQLPLPEDAPANMGDKIQNRLMDDYFIGAPAFKHNGRWWIRVSVQIFTEMSDIEYLAKSLGELCEKIKKELQQENIIL